MAVTSTLGPAFLFIITNSILYGWGKSIFCGHYIAKFSGCICNYDEQAARQEMEVNYFGQLRLINAFSGSLIKNRNTAIVNMISIGGLYPSPMFVTYSASKAALYSLTQAVRIEMMLHSHSISVFGVYPGPIDTDMTQNIEVFKESPANLACRVFDGMEQGIMDITTDKLSDNFVSYLKKDITAIEALKRAFGKDNNR